jgi:hypothetical protein
VGKGLVLEDALRCSDERWKRRVRCAQPSVEVDRPGTSEFGESGRQVDAPDDMDVLHELIHTVIR